MGVRIDIQNIAVSETEADFATPPTSARNNIRAS
jgi:hypothetical protein